MLADQTIEYNITSKNDVCVADKLTYMAFKELGIDYAKYKEELSSTYKAIQQEIVTLEEEGKKLDEQLKVHCEQLQQKIKLGKARIDSLKEENRAKKKALDREDLKASYDKEDINVKFDRTRTKTKSRKKTGWDLAYEYSLNNIDTPVLRKDRLNSWVEQVTKNCAEELRKINQSILEGNLNEIEKITGSTGVEEVSNYVNRYVNSIEELADFFNLVGEIRAVHTAFNMIVEDFKATGFYRRKRSKYYKSYSGDRQNKGDRTQQIIPEKDFPLFKGCDTIKEGKELRKRLSIENHPDRGGCEEEMKRINHQFDLFVRWMEN